MADIKPTQTAITSDDSGLAQGVQTDTSFLKEANTRKTQLFQNVIEGGVEVAKGAVSASVEAGFEQASSSYLDEVQQTDEAIQRLTTSKELFSDITEDTEASAALKEITADLDSLQRKRGQMSAAQYDIMMSAKLSESANKYPWMEKTIAGLHGNVTGRSSAVRDSLAAADKQKAAQQTREHTFAMGILKEASIPPSGDRNTDVNTANQFMLLARESKQQILLGTTRSGTAGFNTDRSGHFNRNVAEMSELMKVGLSDPSRSKESELAIDDYVANEQSVLSEAYGTDVPERVYSAHIARIQARADNMKKTLTGEMAIEVYEQSNAYNDALLQQEVLDIPGVRKLKIASGLFEGNQAMQGLISRQGNSESLTKTVGTWVSNGSSGNVEGISNAQNLATPQERRQLNQFNSLSLNSMLMGDINETQALMAATVNTQAEAMLEGRDWHSDQYFSLTNVLAKKEFLDMYKNQQELSLGDPTSISDAFSPRILQETGVLGMDTGLESIRDTLSQERLSGDLPISDYIEIVYNDDGTIRASAVNLDQLKLATLGGRTGGRHAQIEGAIAERNAARVLDTVDKMNRSSIPMVNNGGKTHAHGNGNDNYGASIGFKVAEFNLGPPIVEDVLPEGNTNFGGEIAPGVTVQNGVVTRDEPVQQARPTVTIDRSPLQGEVPTSSPAPEGTPTLPATGTELDVEELSSMVAQTPAVDTSAREVRLRNFENSFTDPNGGWTGTVWVPHASIELGTDTLAYGHKLQDKEVKSGTVRIGNRDVDYTKGISEVKAQELFQQDWTEAKRKAKVSIKKLKLESLPPRAKMILSEMAFQLKPPHFEGFPSMIRHLKDGNFTKAAKEMRNSKWYKSDSKRRAGILADEMEGLDR